MLFETGSPPDADKVVRPKVDDRDGVSEIQEQIDELRQQIA